LLTKNSIMDYCVFYMKIIICKNMINDRVCQNWSALKVGGQLFAWNTVSSETDWKYQQVAAFIEREFRRLAPYNRKLNDSKEEGRPLRQ